MQKGNYYLILFNKNYCLKQSINFIFYSKYSKNYIKIVSNIVIYLFILVCEESLKMFNMPLEYTKARGSKIVLNNKNNINDWLNFLFNLYSYYNKHFNLFFQFKYFNYVFNSIFWLISNTWVREFLVYIITDENIAILIKWGAITIWTFGITYIIKKKYKEKNLFYSKNYHKFKNKTMNITPSIYLWWRLYFKYNETYSIYLRLKKYFILNENNNYYLYFYNLQTQTYWKQMNIFYELLEKEGLLNSKNKIIKRSLSKVFLKENRVSLFSKKKEITEVIFLISYKNLLQESKLKNNSDVDINILNKYFKELGIMNEIYTDGRVDIFHDALNEPLIVPSKFYNKFEETAHFIDILNDLNKFTIEDLSIAIKKSFKSIENASIILRTNESSKKEKKEKIENVDKPLDPNLKHIAEVWFDFDLSRNPKFLHFLYSLNVNYKYRDLSGNILKMNIFEIENKVVLDDDEIINIFENDDFFNFDYFYIAINNEKYTLCYLLFLYKIKKNIDKYKKYYDEEYKKYHKNKSIINNAINNAFNSFVNCKFDKFLNNNNSQFNIDFLSSVKKKNLNNLRYNIKQKDKHYNYNYKNFLKWFQEYEKNVINAINSEQEFKTFSDFLYSDMDLLEIREKVQIRRAILLEWLHYYNYEGDLLNNFYDIGFYLYNIKGYEYAYQDTIMFYEYKDCEMLNFYMGDNINNILQKTEFQYNYNLLYFYYVISLFKKSNFYVFNLTPDQLLFDDLPIVQKDDSIIYKNYVDSIFYLKHLVKTFKSLIKVNDNIIWEFIRQINMYFIKYKEYYSNIDFNYLYNTDYINKLKDNPDLLYDLEFKFNNLFELWKSLIDLIPENRKSLTDAINLLRIDNAKINTLLNMDIFKNNKSILLLEDAILTKLEEFIINDRKLDNVYNILMCNYRKMEGHNKQFLTECFFKNGYMPKLNYLNIDDWEIVFSLEKQDPIILIKLYNSKQQNIYSELWNSNIIFNTILEELSELDEKQLLTKNYNNEWVLFFHKYRNRDLIIYDLTEDHINELRYYLNINNQITFNQVDIEQEIDNLIQANNFKYNAIYSIYEKITIPIKNNQNTQYYKNNEIKSDDAFYDSLIIKNPQIIENYSSSQKTINKNKASRILAKQGIEINVINEDSKFDSFILFDFVLDNNNNKIKINKQFISHLESKIKKFPSGSFSDYILSLFKKLNSDYDLTDDLMSLKTSINYLFYIVNFYENILKWNSFDISYSKLVNTAILYGVFDYVFYVKYNTFIDDHVIFFDYKKYDAKKDYIEITKELDYKKTFVWLEGKNFLLSIKDILNNIDMFSYIDIDSTLEIITINQKIDHLPKLKENIINCNYSSKLFYSMDGRENSFLFFDEIFNTINTGMLKINNMLNKLIHIKNLIDIYLNFCKKGISNIQIIKELYFLLYKDNNNIAYMQLINLLLYIKDPIYLYNILATDIKCYVETVIDLYDILQDISVDNSFIDHKDLQGRLMHIFLCDEKRLKEKINYTMNLDRNLGFLYQCNLIKKPIYENVVYNIDKYMNMVVSDIIPFAVMSKINKLLSNIIQHKGYFSTIDSGECEYNFNEEFDVLNFLNFNKLKIDFDFLLSINDKILFKSYTVKEFVKSNGDFQALPYISNYNELLSIIEINHYNYKKSKGKGKSWSRSSSESESESESESININATAVARRSFIQFASDCVYRELYKLCRQTFNVALNDINHPIWDECRDLFLNEHHFNNHIKRLTNEDLDILFNNYWSMAIDDKVKELEVEANNKRMSWWWSLLNNVTKKQVEKQIQLDGNDLFLFFSENLEKNKEWKKQWHNDFYYLNKPLKKDSAWKSLEKINKIYIENKSWNDVGYVVEENEGKKNKTKKKKLWNSLDWWKWT